MSKPAASKRKPPDTTVRPRKPRKSPEDINPADIAYKELLTPHEAAFVLSMHFRTVMEYTKRINPVTGKPWLKRIKNGDLNLISRKAIASFIEQKEAAAV